MKRYIHYRAGLLIGLFSLNTLSACVSTRTQVLGFEDNKREQDSTPVNPGSFRHISIRNICLSIRNICYLGVAGLVVVGIVVRARFHIPYLIDQANKPSLNRNNRSRLATCLPLMPNECHTPTYKATYMPSKQAQFIIDAVHRNPIGWVPHRAPGNGITLDDPMILDDRLVNDLKRSRFLKKRIKCWLAKGLHIDAKDKQGRTLLMYAAAYSNKCTIQFLIDKGANVNVRDKDGNTPLHLAVGRRSMAVVKRLVQVENIDLNVVNNDYKTPRDIAYDKGYLEILAAL